MVLASRRVHFEGGEPKTWFDCTELSEDERRAYWLRSADFAEFERNRRAMERVLRRARGDFEKIDATQWCYRGMEEMLSAEYARHMIVQRSNVIKGVLDEQARQRNQAYRDDDGFRKISMSMSECARIHALDLGQHDARVAKTGRNEPIPLDLVTVHATSAPGAVECLPPKGATKGSRIMCSISRRTISMDDQRVPESAR
jgi:hypothetical protein